MRPGLQRERGSVTLFVVIFALAALALASLIVDGGTVLNSEERAADIGEQAARAVASQIDVTALRQGVVQISPNACEQAAALIQQYSTSDNVQVTENACIGVGTRASVTVTVTTRPVIELGFGSFSRTVTEHATVQCGNAVSINQQGPNGTCN